MLKKFFDRTVWVFLLVGLCNTLVGTGLMFALYNLLGVNYWLSSAANYIVGSILSYFLNKRFTFRNTETGWKPVLRFTVQILVCYLLAYGLAKPIVRWLFAAFGETARDNLAMAAGSGLFVVFNYLGQRFFTFRKRNADRNE